MPRTLPGSQSGVSQGAVVVTDGLGSQGNAGPECVDRLLVAPAAQRALPAMELGPEAVRLQGDRAVEHDGGPVEGPAAQEGAPERVVLPGRARLRRGYSRPRWLAPAQRLRVI